MQEEKKHKLMWRWSLITAGTIVLFWTIWYLIAGQVPVTTSIKMTENWTIQLPFSISRWWDVLIGPIWSIVLISLFTNERITKDKDLGVGLVFGLFVLIKWVCSKSFWRTIGNWLLARNAKAEKV